MKEISLCDFKTYYTATVIKTVVSVETMEQNKELRNRLAQIDLPERFFTKALHRFN